MLAQREHGGHQYPNGHTSKTFPNLVLNDACPWEEVDIGNGVWMKCMSFPATAVYDIQLLAPATIVYLHCQRVEEARRSVELAVYTSYLTVYHHFYNTGIENLDQLVASWHPALDYYQLLKGKFDGVAFGDVHVGQISPTGVDIELPGNWEFEGISAGTGQRLCQHI